MTISKASAAALPLLASLLVASSVGAERPDPTRNTIFKRAVIRDGFHFQVTFGIGGGPDTVGVFHAMEIGGTLKNGLTIALLHTFIQSKGVLKHRDDWPDLIGGWMPVFKFPFIFRDLVLKVGLGPGGTHVQDKGIKARVGVGWYYGFDLHYPLFSRSGITLGVQVIQVAIKGAHHWGASIAMGYTFF